ncbi:C39 family peptidase [Planococcus sp. CP5-4]|uniref:C39 family peptidase n=1 Tax=unclassified Planococcus (in: firmicutes) TaxID=2662419 RepID=UPI001C2474E0|nr:MULTISPECIES: C39 family peptidase [unclassified Planococcus (in: firmicutes)]MBU9673887.1 C39 family peptidase [Planococcus sp. CP5-4_YE]MBV0909757.1 C39 family peptidase [Planococcus sp. CP5-4_UN]MBW6065241.1 C39 family peptidase [Planococcus sp. CP5-4]
MMATVHIETADDLVRVIGELWNKKSLRAAKEFLAGIPDEEGFYRLIRMADESDLYGYSNFLATASYKRFGSLRSYAWHCVRLLETGRSLEAEEKILARLQGIHADNYQDNELMHAHHLLMKVYCQLNRIPEAAEQLARIEELGGARPDQQAFFAIHSGDWDGAEKILLHAFPDTSSRWSTSICLLYADLLAMRGAPARSLEVLVGAAEEFPKVHAFHTEQIGRLHQLGRFEEVLAKMEAAIGQNPYHSRKKLFIHLAAHCLYELERFDELDQWIAKHPLDLKDSLYTKTKIDPNGTHKKLSLTPEVQKLNYCVPASLSLILQAFDKTATQDDIAQHVFDVTGSKLQTTMSYMETLGFTARYFKGTIDQYKDFIDAGIPILLSMMIENSAHVQVVVGYDDRLQALVIQDPNDLGPFLVAYDEVPKMFRMTDSLSMAFVDGSRNELLEMLDDSDHRFFTEIYELLDVEPINEAQFVSFLEQHQEQCYAAVIGLTMALSGQPTEWHEQWLERLRAEFDTHDAELELLEAHLYFQKDQGTKALAALKEPAHARSPYALFLKAAISMNEGKVEQAMPLLKRSIELDHYQPLAYSHLARCYLEGGRIFQAYKWSKIATGQLPEDMYAQITHALIQYEYGAVEQAYRRFAELNQKHPEDGYFLYEMGRCLQALDRTEEALEQYRQALVLDSEQPFAYLRMAELFMEKERWAEAQKIIGDGLKKELNQDILHSYLGHIAIEQQQFEQAEDAYRRAYELDPKDFFTPVHIAHALYGQKRSAEALAFLKQGMERADAGYRLRAADLILEQSEDAASAGEALKIIEDGFKLAEGEDLYMLAERYSESGAAPSLRHRVIAGLKELRKTGEPQILCLEAELHEQAGNPRFAKHLYEAAGNIPLALAKQGQLAEMGDDINRAIVLYEQAAAQEAGYAPALGGLVRCYREIGKNQKAFAAVLDFIAAEPLSAVLPDLVGFAATQADIEKLNRLLDRIEDQVPAEWLYAARAHVHEAAGELEMAEKLFLKANEEPNAFPSRFQYVQFLNRRGEHKRALDELKKLLVETPEEEELYSEYVLTLEALGKIPFLKRNLQKWLPADAQATAYELAASAMMNRLEQLEEEPPAGFIKRMRHRSKRLMFASTIITLCETAAKLAPDREDAAIQLAQFYLNRGMAQEAIDELKPYAKTKTPGEAQRMLIFAELQLAEESGKPQHYESVVNRLEAYEELTPLDAEMLAWWGEALEIQEDIPGALEKLDAAIALEVFNPDLYIRKWNALESLDSEMRIELEDSLPEEMHYAEWLILARASSYSTKRHGQRAKEMIEPLLADMPGFVPAKYELARAQAARHQPLAAKTILKELLETEEASAIWEMAVEEDLFASFLVELSSP